MVTSTRVGVSDARMCGVRVALSLVGLQPTRAPVGEGEVLMVMPSCYPNGSH